MENKDVKIQYAEDDLEKVQLKPNMYIQKFGPLGTFHLSKECIQNSFDELEDPNTNGSKILIKYDKLNDKLYIEDDGRGIPEETYPIDIVCTKLQSGSKFFRENGNTSGEFGVGLTVVNALSSYFKLATYRNTYVHIIEFENGKKINDENRPLKKNEKKHGTITEFIVNPKYMGKNSNLPIETVLDWIDDMSYQISSKLKVTVEIYKGIKLEETHKFKTKPFSDMMKKFIDTKKTIYDPVVLSADSKIEEIITDTKLDDKDNVKVKNKKVKKDVHLDVVFTHDEHQETDYISYCNFTRTDEHGVHVDAVEEVICRFIQNKTKATMTEKEKNKWDITWNDIKTGFKMIVNLSTSAQVQFMGNAKNKIQNQDLKPVLKEMIQEKLVKYFEQNQGKLQTICKYVKLNARARVEAQKVRVATKSERLDRFKEYEIPNYIACNNTGKKYKELICVEGERSATGSIRSGRNPDTQAIFGFRGVTKNPYKCSLAEIMANKEWKNFVKVLRTGIGKDFNINKLYFDKIILTSDADVDGFYISEGICAFIALLMPEIITEGKLYKVYPPLYSIDDKSNPFVNSKSDLAKVFMKKIDKVYNIYLEGSKKPMTKDELFDFLDDTNDYYDRLIELQNYTKVDKFFIERLSYFIFGTNFKECSSVDDLFDDAEYVRDFMSFIQEKYPEVNLKKNTLRGPIDGKYGVIKLSERNLEKFSEFSEIFYNYGYEITVEDKKGANEKRTMTIAEFMQETYSLRPKIIQRYKGLGEATGAQIGETTLDPDNRVLVQLTMRDAEKAMKIFNKLNSGKQKYLLERKKMMEEYRINPADLDN